MYTGDNKPKEEVTFFASTRRYGVGDSLRTRLAEIKLWITAEDGSISLKSIDSQEYTVTVRFFGSAQF